ncbi:MAG: twin-arginine translocase subunit TatC [ANME-2 cluster archaeon]|nr:twin-arginine translocase subunit TatC [ANME-2 cluster archaeon]
MNKIPGDQELPLIEHIRELRSRMIIVVSVLIFTLIFAFPFSGNLIEIIWNDLIPQNIDMVVYTPLEWMITRLMLSLVICAAIVVPIIIYELYAFMAKGLYPSEKRFFLKVVPISLLLFLIGAGIAYYIVIPLIYNFMILYSQDVAASGLSVKLTFSVVSTMLIVFGLLFQLPLLVIFSIKSGLVKQQQLKDKRVFVYGILVAFALFVAPDITGMSQLIMAFFLLILFEASLLMGRFI